MKHATEQSLEQFSQEPEWFSQYRKEHFSKSLKKDMPSTRYGLSIFIKPEFDFDTIEPKKSGNVKTNYETPEGVEIGFGTSEDYQEFLTEDWETPDDNHKLYHVHQAFMNDYLVIKIADNITLEKPLEITQDIIDTPVFSTIFVLAGKNSKATILLNKSGTVKNGYVSDDIRIKTEAGSSVEFVTFQNLPKDAAVIQKRTSRVGKDSTVEWIDCCLGSAYTKSNNVNKLVSEGSTGNIKVLFSGKDSQRYDLYTGSLHESKNSYSDILTKGVLNDSAKGLSRGLVRIEQESAGSNGYETQDVLLLSEKAEGDAIPNLEIHNHDVKCSHGSTIGQVDKEKLFYLMSRGLSLSEAQHKLVEGYFMPVIELFSGDTKTKIKKSVLEALQ